MGRWNPDGSEVWITNLQVKMAKVVVGVNICFFAAVVVVGLVALHGAVRLFAVGVLCSALTIAMYAAPMAAMVSNKLDYLFTSTTTKILPFSFLFENCLSHGSVSFQTEVTFFAGRSRSNFN